MRQVGFEMDLLDEARWRADDDVAGPEHFGSSRDMNAVLVLPNAAYLGSQAHVGAERPCHALSDLMHAAMKQELLGSAGGGADQLGVGQARQARLGRSEPHAAEIDCHTGDRAGLGTSADSLACFEDQNGSPRNVQRERGGPGEAGAHHDAIN